MCVYKSSKEEQQVHVAMLCYSCRTSLCSTEFLKRRGVLALAGTSVPSQGLMAAACLGFIKALACAARATAPSS